MGIVIDDPDNRSSPFFSRGKCMVDKDAINQCPVYGCSKEIFASIIREKMEKELEVKLSGIK